MQVVVASLEKLAAGGLKTLALLQMKLAGFGVSRCRSKTCFFKLLLSSKQVLAASLEKLVAEGLKT